MMDDAEIFAYLNSKGWERYQPNVVRRRTDVGWEYWNDLEAHYIQCSIDAAVAAERERCAEIVEGTFLCDCGPEWTQYGGDHHAPECSTRRDATENIAAHIRGQDKEADLFWFALVKRLHPKPSRETI
jgi:hypothetical protein